MAFRLAVALVLSLLFAGSVAAQEARVKLTSLEWPPYSGASLPGGGITVAALRAALAEAGWSMEVEFLPWKRAVEAARTGQNGVVGYFPEYFDEANREFVFSQSMGKSLVGFAEPAMKRFVWDKFEDLKTLGPIGVVDGYVNSPEFDQAVQQGDLKVERVSEDLLNLKKLASGRIRAAVIDRHVMSYLMKNDSGLAAVAGRIAFNEKPLIEQTLHVAFRRTAEAEAARAALNRGLTLLGDDLAKRYLSLEKNVEPPKVAQR